MKNIGAFTGIASTLYVTNHLSRLWKNDYLLQSFLQEQTHTLKEMIPKDERLDMIGGVAGCSIVLLQLYEQLKDPKLLELAKQCGDRLLQTVQRMQQGMGWKVLVSEKPLAGFSHGVSGMAWTLFKLTNVTGNKNYQLVAEQALTFERTLFSRKHLNWYDLRMFNGKSNLERGVMPVAWCHGAPGIALSRLLISPYKNDSFIQKEIEVGIATTLQRGFGINHSLCHGDLGNLDILIFAANQLNDNKLVQTVNDYSQSILQDIKNRGWVTGLHTINNESPSLMLGLAGIGMGLLKIWSPNYIPSILRLQAPAV